MAGAEGGAKTSSEATPWKGGAALFQTPEDDAAGGAKMRVTFDEWHNHSQVGREVQQQVKPRDDSELRGKMKDCLHRG